MPKKRTLAEINLSKIAAVDFPCQEHAQALILKNKDSGIVPDKAGQAGEPDSKEFSMSAINKALGLPETATEAEVLAEIAKRNTAFETLTKSLEKSQEDLTAEKAEKEKIEKARDAAAGDESFTNFDGEVIKKSVMGGAYDMMKKMSLRMEESEIEKSAKVDYPHLDTAEVTKSLRIAKRATADDRAVIEGLLKKQNELMGAAFATKGQGIAKAGQGTSGEATAKIDELAKAKAAKDNITYAQAYDAVTKSAEGMELVKKARAAA